MNTALPQTRIRTASGKRYLRLHKPFNSLTFDELADRIAELGFDGIESAHFVPGGHIEPEAVPDELPKLVEALKKRGLEITVITSDVNGPNDPVNERVLRTAASLGVRRYRMRYFKYDMKKPILQQLDNWRPQVRELAALNAELGITAVYQNHAGRNYCGAPLWDRSVCSMVSPSNTSASPSTSATRLSKARWLCPSRSRCSGRTSTRSTSKTSAGTVSNPKTSRLAKGQHQRPNSSSCSPLQTSRGPISLHEGIHRPPQARTRPRNTSRPSNATSPTLKTMLGRG